MVVPQSIPPLNPPTRMSPQRNVSRRTVVAAAAASAITLPQLAVGQTLVFGETPPAKIRIGQIGTKHPHAAGKLQTIRELGDLYEVVGVVEDDAKQRERVASQPAYRDLPWMTTEQLLNIPGLAAVAVETDVKDLATTGRTCVLAGKHIHLDKPAGLNMRECRALHQAADANSVTVQMGYMLRYNPAFVLLFEAVKEGWIGPITELTAMMGKKASDALRRDLARYPGGGMFELACHLVDAMVYALGKPQSVTAHNRSTYPQKDSFLDNQLAVFDYPNAIATIRCNHLDPFGFPRRHFHVIGQEGHIKIGPLEPADVQLALTQPRGPFKKGTQKVTMPKTSGRYDEEFRDLARVIRGEKELAWNSTHDLAVHETVLRACGLPVD